MASPGGWNANGLGFSNENANIRVFIDGAEQVPLAKFFSDLAQEVSDKETKLLVLESCCRKESCVGFGATRELVERVCQSWGVPLSFLRRIMKAGSLPCFVHLAEIKQEPLAEENQESSALNLGFRWGEGHDVWMVVFGRFDLQSSTLRLFVSSQHILGSSKLLDLMTRESCLLQENPLEIFGLLLESCGRYVDEKAQHCNRVMLAMANSLEVADRNWLKSWNIKPTADSVNKSTAIYRAIDATRWLKKNSQQLIEIGKRYLDLATDLRSLYHYTIPKDEVHDIVHRIELNHHMLVYVERMLESQFHFHNNLLAKEEARQTGKIAVAGQRDSLSMKTVSYLTMFFLPATFVSAVFSTTVFNFQNWHSAVGSEAIVSPGWWVYLICCSLATIITIGVWFGWHRGDLRRWQSMNKGVLEA
jgi:hypothetical protein